ncbi:MAG: hypothetical protein LBO79_10740 [Zoogloeaceae bacterium]|jgi:hypothetical protein|nr:hypothetical protein [Zoogloeaceae bacterium]
MIVIQHRTKQNPTPTELFHDGIAQLWERIGILQAQGEDSRRDLPVLEYVIRLHEIGAGLGMTEQQVGATIERGDPDYQSPEFRQARDAHLRLVDTLGMEHPETNKAFILAFELAPQRWRDEAYKIAGAMDIVPESCGYLEDGTPLFGLAALAEKMGVPLEEATEKVETLMTIRAELGLSNDGFLTDTTKIYRKQ